MPLTLPTTLYRTSLPNFASLTYVSWTIDVFLVSLAAFVLLCATRTTARRQFTTTRLRGPHSTSILTGVGGTLRKARDASVLYEEWAKTFGPVFSAPAGLWSSRIVLCDSRAAAHVYARDTAGYHRPQATRDEIAQAAGHNLLWAEGDVHKRHRRAMIPAFSNAAIRKLTPVFTDAGYKVKESWEILIAESAEKETAVIEVQSCLDSIGIAGFSHDFGALSGARPPVTAFFDRLHERQIAEPSDTRDLLALILPWVSRLPHKDSNLGVEMNRSLGEATRPLLENTRKEKAGESSGGGKEERSIIGLLIKSEGLSEGSEMHMSAEEMKLLIFAGHETTSVALTWMLFRNLHNKNQSAQTKLRESLSVFANSDPSYDQMTNGLPYLDAVITESLRLQAISSVSDFIRVAGENDIIPLSQPIRDAYGSLVNSITVAKGTLISVSPAYMNRSSLIWGSGSREFHPERWLDGDRLPTKAREIQGHRHILSFSDGQRACLGKAFALAEVKVS
ncbi:cytochrome P450 [Coniophora puteana RWD-64-598 SS2]|uniref:Cytochrome P450 n=1 Tax=Coniophora puteana (strain RWD-64-598) TaxID=741705 RepID=A0A5M3MFE8_CONPW|nr:cytochrome P450 [Coniophora puteana RWD-64-598 SS2]EIW77650.1 cytochrome P450 [Coniophora puteana RWD-64-598 SS2]